MHPKPGIYKHFKGDKYRVIGVCKHSETLEELVMYEALYDNPESKLWVRPLGIFMETIERGDTKTPRFQFLKD
ncbi:MAG: DUF1653 domain-containing protein [Candidatus Paceibacterota bacterium]